MYIYIYIITNGEYTIYIEWMDKAIVGVYLYYSYMNSWYSIIIL